ncbi:helix-turn-helix domain-containing protein [Clostridium sp.]|uniref:helix-turn-helix domain-containing protein n=1 Tax=Clostridium sp. TaxID=1506 RepID=UPI002FDCE662
MKLSEKLRELRKVSKLSQEQLAQKLNVTNQAVSRWELGKNYPDILNLVKLCDIYNISLDELIRDDLDFQKSLSSKNRIKGIYLFLFGIFIECLSFLTFYYFNTLNIENSLTNWIIGTTGVIGFVFIAEVLIKKFPKRIRYWLGIE